ncbi:MAG: hypothetical protein JXR55_07930 [Candidatus Fermentibacteraceae bacterium]|nr:hypothetical protein [Candidatus Fermentibacteraceae bacterium]
MRIAALALAMMTGLGLGDFLDDFESYSPGEDPDISPDWSREPGGGYVLVAENGGNQVIEAFFPDSAYIGYLCDGADIWGDGSVSMDVSVTGSGTLMTVIARLQLFSGEAYVGGLIVWFQPFTYAYIGHVSMTGEYELLYSGTGPTMTPGTWSNVRLELEGENPVTLALYLDDQPAAQVQDSTYNLGPGLSGFALIYDSAVPSVLADNFEVVLAPQAMEAMTFGALKAAFSD